MKYGTETGVWFTKYPCPKCGDMNPIVYAEGVAKKVFDEDGDAEFHFTSVDGYVCECPECGAQTRYHMTLLDAVGAWNSGMVDSY